MLPNFVPGAKFAPVAPAPALNASWLKVSFMNNVHTGWSSSGDAAGEDDKARDKI